MIKSLTIEADEPELIMWDGNGTAHFLAREKYTMTPRMKAITRSLLLLAISELEAE